MRSPGSVTRGLVLVLTLVIGALATSLPPAAAASSPASDPARRSLFYRVEARVDTFLLQAEVVGGGRLLMQAGSPEPGHLSLLRPLEDPWKLYRVKSLGREEAKHAAVVTLPEVSWEALEAATTAMEARGRARARAHPWGSPGGRDETPSFDGSFTYVVIGPAAGRFEVLLPLTPADRRVEVRNRLTDRWLPGDFGSFVAAWAAPGAAELTGAPMGYWFWNQGETAPFAWEPHTYHAFAEALALLGAPSPTAARAAASSGDPQALPRLGEQLVRILETLFPKASGRLPAVSEAAVEFRLRPSQDGSIWLQGQQVRARGANHRRRQLQYRRDIVLQPEAALPVSDRIEAELRFSSGWLRVRVGYELPDTGGGHEP